MKRRIICGKVGNAKFVQNAHEVNESEGLFLLEPQSDLANFLSDELTGAVFLNGYCYWFKENDNEHGV